MQPLRNGTRPASQMQAPCSSRRMLPRSTCHQKRDTQLGFWMASSAGSASSVTNPLQTALRQSGEQPTATLPFLRNVPLCSIHTAVARLTAYFSEPHQVITLTAEAESWHLSYQGAMNVQSHVVRGDVQAGARFGAAPWQVGVLAALLLVFEIFVGAHSVEALQAKALQVTSQHLQRAYAVLQLAP